MEQEWFMEWFRSPYYPLLYQYRDEGEASQFIDHILRVIHPKPHSKILDLACGKGRLSVQLAGRGFEVTGIDLAEENISYAQQFENERLTFFKHDMREPFRVNFFDYVFNFFTSFGYFEDDKDHLRTLKNVRKNLRNRGLFVLDYFNAPKVVKTMVAKEEKEVDGVLFKIKKSLKDGFILKDIEVHDQGKVIAFQERVRAFEFQDFMQMFAFAELPILYSFGSYELTPFDIQTSDRLILIARK